MTPYETPDVAGTPYPTATPRSTVTLTAGRSRTHVGWEGVGFDIPAGWTFRPANIDEHYLFIVGFIGTAPTVAECVPTRVQGATQSSMCQTYALPGSGEVSIMLETGNGPGPHQPMDYLDHRDPSSIVVDVDGVPALPVDRRERSGLRVLPACSGDGRSDAREAGSICT